MLAPPNRGGLNSTHIHGTSVPVEEPSTASIPDSRTPAKQHLYSITSSARASSASATVSSGAHQNASKDCDKIDVGFW